MDVFSSFFCPSEFTPHARPRLQQQEPSWSRLARSYDPGSEFLLNLRELIAND